MPTEPTKFTPEILRQIKEWSREGLAADLIAIKIGTSVQCLRQVCSNNHISLQRREVSLKLQVAGSTYYTIDRYASATGRTVPDLVRDILVHIAEDDLFKAVLDDDEAISREEPVRQPAAV